MYLTEGKSEETFETPRNLTLLLVIAFLGTIGIGIFPGFFINLVQSALVF